MRLDGGMIQDIDTEVGGSWRERSGAITDLGVVPPEEAADYLLTLAESSGDEAAEDAIFPATIARGVETWPRLLQIARNDDAREDVRTQAVFWLGQQASQRATEGLVSIIEDEDELEVRETAVFALSQRDEEMAVDALIRIAREHREPQLRKQAIFWLGQRAEDPRVLTLFEEILTGGP
jgi:HEAT repeat protein